MLIRKRLLMMPWSFGALCAAFVGTSEVRAQSLTTQQKPSSVTAGASTPTFPAGYQPYDVISVKSNHSGGGSMMWRVRDSSLEATNVTIQMLLTTAYELRAGQMAGLPKWAESSHWDIQAKVVDPDPANKDAKVSNQEEKEGNQRHIRQVLSDRFGLKFHWETREQPVYDLVVGKSGVRMKESNAANTMTWTDHDVSGKAQPVEFLVEVLQQVIDRNVIDKTGLTGLYDLHLSWTPDEQSNAAKDAGVSNPPPGIFTAVQEQLGLKLVPDKATVPFLVVDALSQPEAN